MLASELAQWMQKTNKFPIRKMEHDLMAKLSDL